MENRILLMIAGSITPFAHGMVLSAVGSRQGIIYISGTIGLVTLLMNARRMELRALGLRPADGAPLSLGSDDWLTKPL